VASGKFITLEGGEGGGKSTQAALLAQALRKAGFKVLLTREPGGTPRAEAIRKVLLSGEAKQFGPLAEAVLFYAARESHLELSIRPALESGAWVVCDRFSDSTRAYQGAAGGVSRSIIEVFESTVVGTTRPDLTLIFDVAPEVGLQRAAERQSKAAGAGQSEVEPDRFEAMNLTFHGSLREEFLAIAKAEPARCKVLDASRSVQAVADEVWSIVRKRFGL
jgi:dTMP kinase